jgi:hypothetical protein
MVISRPAYPARGGSEWNASLKNWTAIGDCLGDTSCAPRFAFVSANRILPNAARNPKTCRSAAFFRYRPAVKQRGVPGPAAGDAGRGYWRARGAVVVHRSRGARGAPCFLRGQAARRRAVRFLRSVAIRTAAMGHRRGFARPGASADATLKVASTGADKACGSLCKSVP